MGREDDIARVKRRWEMRNQDINTVEEFQWDPRYAAPVLEHKDGWVTIQLLRTGFPLTFYIGEPPWKSYLGKKGHKRPPTTTFEYIYNRGLWEKSVTRDIEGYVCGGDTVIDVGGSIGYYTVLLSKLVGPGGRVYTFEPNHLCLEHIERNLFLNDCHNVVILSCGASNVDSGHSLQRSGSTLNSFAQGEIPVWKIDTVLKLAKVSSINFIKVDTDGTELQVLQGAREVLANSVDVAMSVEAERTWNENVEHIYDEIVESGFTVYKPRGRKFSREQLQRQIKPMANLWCEKMA